VVRVAVDILVELFEDVSSFLLAGNVVVDTEKHLQCDQAVATGLMTIADSFNTKLKSQLIQSSTQVELQCEGPYVKKFGEEKFHVCFKKVARLGQLLPDQDFHDVGEIVGAVEADPGELVIEYKTRLDEFFCKVLW